MSRNTSTAELLEPRAIELDPISPGPASKSDASRASLTSAVRASREEADVSAIHPVNEDGGPDLSKWRTAVIIITISFINLLNSMLGGLLIVGLPRMAEDIGLEHSLLLWPAAVNALSCGCTLLISGSIADVFGGRRVYLTGCFLLTATTIACGLSKTGIQLILFRAFQGIAISLCLPSSIQLITSNIPTGPRRNLAFAALGAGQPVGFSIGLVLGGFFVEGPGWRYGYYMGAVLVFIVSIFSIFGIPKERQSHLTNAWQRLWTEIDWIGCLMLSVSLGLLSYVFSVLTGGTADFTAPVPIALLVIATLLIPIFGIHVRRQERLKRPCIIPPSLWSNVHFTSLCLIVFLSWSAFQIIQFFLTLYFQSVLSLSPIQTSLRFLPMVVTGALTNFVSGHLVSRIPANYLVLVPAAISAITPLLLATIDTSSSYWFAAFWATALAPISVDILFTVSNLVITQAFPNAMHGIAGGVFNTVINIANSVGLAVAAVVAAAATSAAGKEETYADKLMHGYRVVFWLCFGLSLLVLVVAGVGMRSIGKVGVKRE